MSPAPEELAALAEALRARHELPGLALAHARVGKGVRAAAAGRADLERDVALRPDGVFEIASITKLFTAEAVMLLARDGALALDDALAAHLPDLPEPWRGVTVRHCLTHQSGIPSYTEGDAYWRGVGRDRAPDEILALAAAREPTSAPGARYAYDNTGFFLLGLLLERVAGAPYGALLAERVFAPRGLASTRANDYAAVVPGRVAGYVREGELVRNKPYYSVGNTFSAGVLLSSAGDLAGWASALLAEAAAGAAGGGPVLGADDREAMWTPHPSGEGNERAQGFSLGLGWFLVDVGGRTLLGHNGGVRGFASALLADRARGEVAVALANGEWLEAPHRVALAVLDSTGPRRREVAPGGGPVR